MSHTHQQKFYLACVGSNIVLGGPHVRRNASIAFRGLYANSQSLIFERENPLTPVGQDLYMVSNQATYGNHLFRLSTDDPSTYPYVLQIKEDGVSNACYRYNFRSRHLSISLNQHFTRRDETLSLVFEKDLGLEDQTIWVYYGVNNEFVLIIPGGVSARDITLPAPTVPQTIKFLAGPGPDLIFQQNLGSNTSDLEIKPPGT